MALENELLIIETWKKIFQVDSELLSELNMSVKFSISDLKQYWLLTCSENPQINSCFETAKADCVVEVSQKDLMSFANNTLNIQQAYLENKLKITGKIESALKLNRLFGLLMPAPQSVG
jgi:putative sterol carrier protein